MFELSIKGAKDFIVERTKGEPRSMDEARISFSEKHGASLLRDIHRGISNLVEEGTDLSGIVDSNPEVAREWINIMLKFQEGLDDQVDSKEITYRQALEDIRAKL